MVGLESTMEQAETAKKVKKPEVADAERERQEKFLAQLRERKPTKIAAGKPAAKPVKAKAKAKSKKGKKMTTATKGETYYCTVCGGEVLCTTDSESPIICCDEVMYIVEL
jgi:hypothetical protein